MGKVSTLMNRSNNSTRQRLHSELEELERKMYILIVYIFPIICFMGLVAHIMSMKVLFRHACKKAYFFILTMLVIFDFSCTCTFFWSSITAEFGCSDLFRTKTFYHHFIVLCNVIDNVSAYCAFQMPVFVTAERVLLLFYPSKYRNIITVKRTAIIISLTFIANLTWAIYRISEISGFSSSYKPCLQETNFDPLREEALCAVKIAWLRNADELSSAKKYTGLFIYFLPVLLTVSGNIVIVYELISISQIRKKLQTGEISAVPVFRETVGSVLMCTSFVLCAGTMALLKSGILENSPLYQHCGIEKFKYDTYMKELVNLIAIINFLFDPILYIIFNSKTRKEVLINIVDISNLAYSYHSCTRHSTETGEPGDKPKFISSKGNSGLPQSKKSFKKVSRKENPREGLVQSAMTMETSLTGAPMEAEASSHSSGYEPDFSEIPLNELQHNNTFIESEEKPKFINSKRNSVFPQIRKSMKKVSRKENPREGLVQSAMTTDTNLTGTPVDSVRHSIEKSVGVE